MLAVLILSAALTGQATANDGPPRTWYKAYVHGRLADVWGWRDNRGYIHHSYEENHHLYPQFAPKPAPKSQGVPIGAGLVLESSGAINSGLKLEQVQHTATPGWETNDPALGAKLEAAADCPDGRCPPTPPSIPDAPPYREYLLPGAIFAGASLVAIAVLAAVKK